MDNGNLRVIETSALLLSIFVPGVCLPRSAGWEISSGHIPFILWVVSPYICLFLLDVLLQRAKRIPEMPLFFCVVSLLMLGFTLFAYVGTMGDKSSTYGLIFIFVPFYLYVGSFILVVGNVIWVLLLEPSKDKNN